MPSPLKIVELCQKPIFASYFDHLVSKSEEVRDERLLFGYVFVAFSPHKSAVRTKPPSGRGYQLIIGVLLLTEFSPLGEELAILGSL